MPLTLGDLKIFRFVFCLFHIGLDGTLPESACTRHQRADASLTHLRVHDCTKVGQRIHKWTGVRRSYK